LCETATRPLTIFVGVLMLAGSISASDRKGTVLHAFRGTRHCFPAEARERYLDWEPLYSFKGIDSYFSAAEVRLGEGGSLYGTAVGHAGNAGMVFEILPCRC